MEILEEEITNVQTSIRIREDQLQMLESYSVTLSYVKNGQKTSSTFDMGTPDRKQDWLMEYRAVKLSPGRYNRFYHV